MFRLVNHVIANITLINTYLVVYTYDCMILCMYVPISIPPGEVGVIQIISWGPIKNILRKRGQIYIMMIVNKQATLFYKISTLESEL